MVPWCHDKGVSPLTNSMMFCGPGWTQCLLGIDVAVNMSVFQCGWSEHLSFPTSKIEHNAFSTRERRIKDDNFKMLSIFMVF